MSSDLATLLNQAATFTAPDTAAVPWIFTSALRRERRAAGNLRSGEQAFVSLPLNPHEASFTGPRRINRQNTQGGTIVWYFTDENDEANDLLELTLKINTDSIDERLPDEAMKHLKAWTNLLLLAREKELTDTGKPNIRQLIFETPAMPYMIQFDGYFESAPDPNILADQPHSMDVTVKFIVTASEPPIREWAAILETAVLGLGTGDPMAAATVETGLTEGVLA